MEKDLSVKTGLLKGIIAIAAAGAIVLAAGCSSGSAESPGTQIDTVTRGDLDADITGVGNLAFSHTEDLAFDIPSSFNIVTAVSFVIFRPPKRRCSVLI